MIKAMLIPEAQEEVDGVLHVWHGTVEDAFRQLQLFDEGFEAVARGIRKEAAGKG